MRFHGNLATIESVSWDPAVAKGSHHGQFAAGVMVFDPEVSGHTFIPVDQLHDYEDLEFVSRADSQ